MNLLDLVYVPVAVVTAPMWASKKRHGWKERFGHTPPLPVVPTHARGRILIHAVSVGEVAAIRHLVPLLAPHADVVVSVTTDTGIQRARELFGDSCTVVRYPLDFSRSVSRFLDAVKPDAVALVELEIWPNFVRACVARDIPICIINGRLSARSFRGYFRIKRFIAPIFRSLKFAAVQDLDYAGRFQALGLPPGRCFVTGSMKWDAARIEDNVPGAERLALELGIDREKPLIVAGSTGPGEEALLHDSCPGGVQLLCAPRKIERFDEAERALPECVRRSVWRGREAPRGRSRFLLDTIGELRAAYSLADVVVVGRSFGSQYGSDPIEPVALGKPTVIGPAVSDFAAVVSAFEQEGGIVRSTPGTLGKTLESLIGDPARRSELARKGRDCIRKNQGASGRNAGLLWPLLPSGRAQDV